MFPIADANRTARTLGQPVETTQVVYPTTCGSLCKLLFDAATLVMQNDVRLAFDWLTRQAKSPVSAHYLLALEAHRRDLAPTVLYAEMITALGRSGKDRPEQIFVMHTPIFGDTTQHAA